MLTEAAARLRLQMNSLPEDLDKLARNIKQLEIERAAIKRENDKKKLEELDKEINSLKEEEKTHKAKWQAEKSLIDKIQQSKIDIEKLKFEADQAERNGDYGRVAEIRYGRLKDKQANIEKYKEELLKMQEGNPTIKEEVDSNDVADIVSRWTGIPVSKMTQSEQAKLLNLEAELHKRVIGQDEAIEAVASAVRRSRAGLKDPKRPIGSFIFLGTTGVGKTELAKALAESLFDDDNMMTRIDMSEYQEKFSVTRLIGSPPGYIGYEEGGQLTEAIRRKPYSVVLFDEIEKAHPDVFNILLQVLDDGRLTDNKGRVVDFKNTIIIMTSNLGSQLIRQKTENLSNANREEVLEDTRKEVFELLKQVIKPEFLNRIDDLIMFTPLSEDEIAQIVRLQVEGIAAMLKENGIDIMLTPKAIELIASEGFDPQFGARPIKRALQRLLLNELAEKIISGTINKQEQIVVDEVDGKLIFKN